MIWFSKAVQAEGFAFAEALSKFGRELFDREACRANQTAQGSSPDVFVIWHEQGGAVAFVDQDYAKVSGIPRSARTSRQSAIASLIFSKASARVCPWLIQPGIAGHSTTHIPSSSRSITVGNLMTTF
jgi:ferredoxin